MSPLWPPIIVQTPLPLFKTTFLYLFLPLYKTEVNIMTDVCTPTL